MNASTQLEIIEAVFRKARYELVLATQLLLREQLLSPALLILYAAIDIMASLDLPSSDADVTRADFCRWVDKYLLPDSGLGCTSTDLYGARCGLLHSYQLESSLSRQGKAQRVVHVWGPSRPETVQPWFDGAEIDPVIAIHIDDLLRAYNTAARRFEDDICTDPERLSLASRRGQKLLTFLTPPRDRR